MLQVHKPHIPVDGAPPAIPQLCPLDPRSVSVSEAPNDREPTVEGGVGLERADQAGGTRAA